MKLLPEPQRRADIHFFVLKHLPYLVRLQIIAACFICGLVIQLFINFWAGLVFLALGTVLSLIKGYAATPKLSSAEEWKQVTPDEYDKIRRKEKQLRAWDRDAFDITNPLGVFVFATVAFFVLIVWIVLEMRGAGRAAAYWKWDAAIIFIPHWLTGVRSYLTRDKLIVKINFLENISKMLAKPSDIQVLPMLSTRLAKEGGRVPVDARLMIRFLNAPDYFLGMQIQISINTVQGTDYPYLYCVLIAKKEADFFNAKASLLNNPPKNILFERTKSEGVDVLVIRQRTTQTSGYHTPLPTAHYVVATALQAAHSLLELIP
ncbi:MAG: hypothetical protein KJ893_06660 [Candidatus Omnitrophica bacterium]|nr:hypothetical protein [Candidatus Omnitrophota bacterium]MBU4479461.1 hypothetical protein [Candidatus Omnitrophota bacterium]MCG2703488.1 hypothetical protein [Candidatus Omnitrophota bacterium]